MKEISLTVFLIAMLIGGLAFANNAPLTMAQTSTQVSGIINTDATWTKANSPYNLTGPVAVNKGVTLTIEPGATININSYYIQVNGTLIAQGSETEKIQLYDGSIEFLSGSIWNEQSVAGSVMENANLESVSIDIRSSSPKISSNTISNSLIQCQIQSLLDSDVSPEISNNYIIGTSIIAGGGSAGSAVILNNTILCTNNQRVGISAGGWGTVISNNTIAGVTGYGIEGGKYITGNIISGFYVGIYTGYSTVEGNLIFNNTRGLEISETGSVVRNNSIINNSVGVHSAKGYFNFNNFENNSDYNMYVQMSASDVNATFNWWGTTDEALISQSIFDFKNDYNLGTVNFVPFLTEANPQAMPDPNLPAPTQLPTPTSTATPTQLPSPTQSPTVSPTQTSTPDADQSEPYPVVVVGLAVAVAVLAAAVVVLLRRKTELQSS